METAKKGQKFSVLVRRISNELILITPSSEHKNKEANA